MQCHSVSQFVDLPLEEIRYTAQSIPKKFRNGVSLDETVNGSVHSTRDCQRVRFVATNNEY